MELNIVRGINILLFFILLEMNFAAAYHFRRTTIGTTFLYYLPGLICLGIINILFFLTDSRVVSMHAPTLFVVQHLLFYIGILLHGTASFFFVNLFVHTENHHIYQKRAQVILALSVLVLIALWALIPAIDQFATTMFVNSFAETSGLLEFVAILELIGASMVVMRIKAQLGRPMDTVVNPYLAFLFILGGLHVWDLIAYWKLVDLPAEKIALVESTFWTVAYVFLMLAVIRFRKRSELAEEK